MSSTAATLPSAIQHRRSHTPHPQPKRCVFLVPLPPRAPSASSPSSSPPSSSLSCFERANQRRERSLQQISLDPADPHERVRHRGSARVEGVGRVRSRGGAGGGGVESLVEAAAEGARVCGRRFRFRSDGSISSAFPQSTTYKIHNGCRVWFLFSHLYKPISFKFCRVWFLFFDFFIFLFSIFVIFAPFLSSLTMDAGSLSSSSTSMKTQSRFPLQEQSAPPPPNPNQRRLHLHPPPPLPPPTSDLPFLSSTADASLGPPLLFLILGGAVAACLFAWRASGGSPSLNCAFGVLSPLPFSDLASSRLLQQMQGVPSPPAFSCGAGVPKSSHGYEFQIPEISW